jgi:hypothetical protein
MITEAMLAQQEREDPPTELDLMVTVCDAPPTIFSTSESPDRGVMGSSNRIVTCSGRNQQC